ncbi:hypothetical protein OF83DRAFT_1126870, partial [Amylostereum chailletii]
MRHMELFQTQVDCDPGQGVLDYVRYLHSITPMDVDDTSNTEGAIHNNIVAMIQKVQDEGFANVERQARAGNTERKVDLGLRYLFLPSTVPTYPFLSEERYYSGFQVEKDVEAALKLWREVTNDAVTWQRVGEPYFAIAAKAFLCLSLYYIDLYAGEDKDGFDLVESAKLSDMSLQLTKQATPLALHVAQILHRTLREIDGAPLPEKDKKWMKDRSAPLTELWKAFERRNRAVEARERKMEEKTRKAPNAYECARDGCGMRATSQAALRRCGGKCPPEIKPHYCSPACQKLDWPKHKRDCKTRPGNAPTSLVQTRANPSASLSSSDLS